MLFRKIEEKDKKQLFQLQYKFHVMFHREKLLKDSPIRPIIEYINPDISIKKAIEEMYDGSHFCFVSEENGRIIEFITGKIMKHLGKVFNKEGYIDDLFVIEGYRSKGIGRKLYTLLLKEFKKQKCTHLGIEVYAENKKAQDLYHKLRFHDFILILKKRFNE